MKTINKQQLKDILSNNKGAAPITVIARTIDKKTKTAKVARINGFIGFDYENSVRQQQMREDHFPTFEAAPRVWGHKVGEARNPLIKNGEKYYIAIRPLKVVKTRYYVEGKLDLSHEIDYSEENSRQPIEKKVTYRNYSLESIVAIKMGGVTMRVRQD